MRFVQLIPQESMVLGLRDPNLVGVHRLRIIALPNQQDIGRVTDVQNGQPRPRCRKQKVFPMMFLIWAFVTKCVRIMEVTLF